MSMLNFNRVRVIDEWWWRKRFHLANSALPSLSLVTQPAPASASACSANWWCSCLRDEMRQRHRHSTSQLTELYTDKYRAEGKARRKVRELPFKSSTEPSFSNSALPEPSTLPCSLFLLSSLFFSGLESGYDLFVPNEWPPKWTSSMKLASVTLQSEWKEWELGEQINCHSSGRLGANNTNN